MAETGSGFDMSKLSTASKILLIGSAVLLLDSFLPWQKVCVDLSVIGVGDRCGSAGMWGGDAGFFGVIAGLLTIALLAWEIIGAAGQRVEVGMPASKVSAYLGFGVLGFGILKFLLVMTNFVSYGAFIGLVCILAIGYGAWMRLQEPATVSAPPPGDGGGAPS